MSIRVMADVWDFGPETALECGVLAQLANHANDEGVQCFPSVPRIARLCRISERSVSRAIALLEEEGWITVTRGNGRGNFSRYQIHLEKLKRVTSTTVKGDTVSEKGDNDDKPLEPLIGRTVIEPSGNPEPTPLFSEEKQPEGKDPKQRRREAIGRLFGLYTAVTGRDPDRYTLTPARLEKGLLRFEECLRKVGRGGGKIHEEDWQKAGEMFRDAILALSWSDFHMGRDAKTDGKKYNDWIDNLCKSTEQFEKWLEG